MNIKSKIIRVVCIIFFIGLFTCAVGVRYTNKKEHPAIFHIEPEISHIEPAVTHTIYHPAITQKGDCIRANINYDYIGKCATARCADGTYTGTPYVHYYLTCNHHGGVVAYGPFYYPDKVITNAWTEVVVDKPAQKIIDKPEVKVIDKEAWVEPAYWSFFGIKF